MNVTYVLIIDDIDKIFNSKYRWVNLIDTINLIKDEDEKVPELNDIPEMS